MQCIRPCSLLLLGLSFLASPFAYGQDVDESQASPKEWLAARQAEFEQYRFRTEASPPTELKLEPRSLLNWSNAERGADVGAVFLWTLEGRPEVIACGFGRGKTLRHEFHSLSTDPIVAEREGAAVHRFRPGIEWRELENAPPPGKTRPLRLTQMRRQAERFRVTMGDPPTEMRVLTQPVYRTPAEAKGDLALFLFVQGTDPECVLSMEATEDGKWRYGLTRQTKWAVQAELDGVLLADAMAWQGPKDQESPFFVLTPPAATTGP